MPKRASHSSKYSEKIKDLEDMYGDVNDYSISIYNGYNQKISIKHKITGIIYEQNYMLHKKGLKPLQNLNYTFIIYIERCNLKFNNRFKYSNYQGFNKRVDIYDTFTNLHFSMNAQLHLEYIDGLASNADCLNEYDVFKKKANEVHNNAYEYVEYLWKDRLVIYINKITSKQYTQNIYEHINGSITRAEISDNTFHKFVLKATSLHNGEYVYSDFKDYNKKLTVTNIKTGKSYQQKIQHILNGSKPKEELSYMFRSKVEISLMLQLKERFPNLSILNNHRPKWLNRKELDIYIPELNLAIEYNGTVYHHSSLNTREFFNMTRVYPDYHIDKSKLCLDNGVKLIHIFDFEYINSDFNFMDIVDKYINFNIDSFESKSVYVHPITLQIHNSDKYCLLVNTVIPHFSTSIHNA